MALQFICTGGHTVIKGVHTIKYDSQEMTVSLEMVRK